MQIATIATTQTMSSREIAELVNSRHDSVKRTVDRCSQKGVFAIPPLVEYLDSAGRGGQHEYMLKKRDSLIVVAQLCPEFTARIIDRWQELESKAAPSLPSDYVQALRQLADQTEKAIALEAKALADAPKVAFAEAIRAVDGVCSIDKIAKTIGFGRNKFFKRLRDDGILIVNNLPYQKYIDRGYFTVVENEPFTDGKGVSHPTFTTMVTGAGQVFLAKRYAAPMASGTGVS